VAAEAAQRGEPVVLIVAPDQPPVARPAPGPGGRLAVFVGAPADSATWEAAAAMEAELFGGTAPGPG
jgi:hypothetical protein